MNEEEHMHQNEGYTYKTAANLNEWISMSKLNIKNKEKLAT